MSGRHAGAPDLTAMSLIDQAAACHDEIAAFYAARSAAPIQTDLRAAYRETLDALIEAEKIMHRAAMLLGSVIGRG